jgi:hypothetical protein
VLPQRPGVTSGGPVLDCTSASGGTELPRATVAGSGRRAETQVSPAAYLYSRVRVWTVSVRFEIDSFSLTFVSIRTRIFLSRPRSTRV